MPFQKNPMKSKKRGEGGRGEGILKKNLFCSSWDNLRKGSGYLLRSFLNYFILPYLCELNFMFSIFSIFNFSSKILIIILPTYLRKIMIIRFTTNLVYLFLIIQIQKVYQREVSKFMLVCRK